MKKRKVWIPTVLILLLAAALVYFFQFTTIGYRITVPLRGFDALQGNVYVDRAYAGDRTELNDIVKQAVDRNRAFWGELKSAPVLIITDSEATVKKLGGDHDTTYMVLFGAHSYIAVSEQYLNVDIVAHELTHAEMQKRLYDAKALSSPLIPIWFDEGVATQNDYREQYSEERWTERTKDGEDVISFDQMDTAAEFYADDADQRQFHYLLSRHEVKTWIDRNGVEALYDLVERVNQGEDFYTLYDR